MRLRYLKKKTLALPLSFVLLLVVGIGAAKVMVSKRWCAASWGRPFYLDHGHIAFPDAYAAYWVRGHRRQDGGESPGQELIAGACATT